jgi:hypothetical protein
VIETANKKTVFFWHRTSCTQAATLCGAERAEICITVTVIRRANLKNVRTLHAIEIK